MIVKIDKKRAENLLYNTKYFDYKQHPEKGLQAILDVDLIIDDFIDSIKEEAEETRKKYLSGENKKRRF